MLTRLSEKYVVDPVRVYGFWADFCEDDWALTSSEPVTGTSPWIGTALSSGTTAFSDAAGGTVVLSGAATTDNSGSQIQMDLECFAAQANKDISFYSRFKVSNATDSHVYAGLGITDTTFIDGSDGFTALAHSDSIGFYKPDDAAVLYFVAVKSSTVQLQTAIATLTDDTYVEVEFVYKASSTAGSGTVQIFVNKQYVTQVTSANFPTTELTPTLAQVSGTATGTVSATFDAVGVQAER